MRKRVTCVVVFILVWGTFVRSQTSDQINLLLSTLPAGRDTQRYKNYVAPQFKTFVQRSFYLPMRDGVKIAVQLVLPKDRSARG